MNQSLLCKWWWKIEKGEGLWQEIVQKKYIKQSTTICMLKTKPSNFPVWNDLLKVKDLYLRGRIMIVGDGKMTDLAWISPLKEKFHVLFDICNEQNGSVFKMAQKNWQLSFRRWLTEDNQTQLTKLSDLIRSFPMGSIVDTPKWVWEKSGIFSVKSIYEHMFHFEIHKPNKRLRKAKIALRIKLFMWLVGENAILTKDNMVKRKW